MNNQEREYCCMPNRIMQNSTTQNSPIQNRTIQNSTRHKRMKGFLFLLSVLFLCLWLPGLSANAVESGSPHAKGVTEVKVAFYPLDGFFEYDANGKETGYGVEYLENLEKYGNIHFTYVPADSWEGIKQMMIDGTVDLRLPVSEPTNPSGNYDYTIEPIMTTYHAIMCKKGRDDLYYEDYDTIKTLNIGIAEGMEDKTGMADYLDSIGVRSRLISFDSYNAMKEALDTGEIDALISNVMDLTEDMKILSKFSIVKNYITTWKGNPVYTVVNNAMTQQSLEDPTFASKLYEKWFPERSVEPFTKAETEFIKENPIVTIATYPDRRPVSYYNAETGEYDGIAIDTMNLILDYCGLKAKYVPITTDTQVGMFSDDAVDLVMPLASNPDSDKYFLTSSFLDSQVIMAVRSGEENIPQGATVGVLKSTPGIRTKVEELGLYHLVSFNNSKEALEALQKKQIKAYANSSYVVNWLLESPIYDDLSSLHYQGIPLNYSIAGRVEDSVLLSILNKGIRTTSQQEIETIIRTNSAYTMSDLTMIDRLSLYRQPILVAILALLVLLLVSIVNMRTKDEYIQQIEENVKQKDKANQAKSDFLARMSHDMRTPLNVIIGMSQLARENDNPPDTDECLSKINTASDFLLGLINDILDMEHIDSGKMELHLTPYSAKNFSDYINSVIRPLCEQKNIHFRYETEGNSTFTIMQDQLRINQIYFNLLTNATKYTQEGGEVLFHTVIHEMEDQKIAIDVEIKDNGIGMSEEFQKHMFESFSQENQTVKPIGEGTGLGLSIVKRLCDLMGMTISVSSKLGEGTTFTIHGCFDRVEEVASDQEEEATTVEESSTEDILHDRHILVCEDHPMNQEIIRRLLEKKGMIVVIAENGKRGVEAFERSSLFGYAAILMDVRMPVMDGLQATVEIRAMSRKDAKTIPIIALTANAYEEDIRNCLAAGMNQHLAKPINTETMYHTLVSEIEKANQAADKKE